MSHSPWNSPEVPAVSRVCEVVGCSAVGWGDGHLFELPAARPHARWLRAPRPSALRLPSLSSGLHPCFQRRLLGLSLAA